MSNPAAPDSLAQVHELNRLYLRSLQSRKTAELAECGFPAGAVGALRAAGAQLIDALAEFPRALFDLKVSPPAANAPGPEAGCSAREVLALTIVFCAWNVSRDSAYHARLFFGLPTRAVHTLRTTPLSLVPRLALTSARVDCAFPDSEWLWRELLTERRPEVRRRLILVALQPSADGARALDRVAERGLMA
ncbi:MAG: hypothetical protein JXB36_16165 [Gammaproteobacteria bacterium]|nr:hypothetical protein [Gammaproteobacteria bacterium]